jgi:sugar phosphate isomerase/epimerase
MILASQNDQLSAALGHEATIDIMKEAGYDAIDMSLFSMSNDNDIFNSDAYKSRTLELAAYAKQKGIYFNQSHVPFTFRWSNPNEYEERCFPRQIRGLAITALLGAKIAIVHPMHHCEYKGNEEALFAQNMKFYRDLLPYAKEFDVKIALENMWQIDKKRKYISEDVCSRATEFARYIDALDDEHFVACLDLGHCGLIGEEAEDAIRILGHDRLKALHVHDNDYRSDMHTLPFLQNMNWDAIMKALADIRYDGDFTFEADNFLSRLPNDFKPRAVKFMVDTGRYLIDIYDKHLANS